MKFIVGTKEGMTQVFDDAGSVAPATVVRVWPMTVTRVKTIERDGYHALQVGFYTKKPKMDQKNSGTNFSGLREWRLTESPTAAIGETISTTSLFSPGDKVVVRGLSKGKGFQGVVKRHGFSGGPRSHGQKHSEREPGSIGGGLRTRVPKGMRMPGRTGGKNVAVKNLVILAVRPEEGEIILSGAVPGRRGTIVEIRSIEPRLPSGSARTL